jgi:hypothetical protein
MPMPVSRTLTASTASALASSSRPGLQPPRASSNRSSTSPVSVNLKALESRFLRTCRSRCGSVTIVEGRSSARWARKPRPCPSAIGVKLCTMLSRSAGSDRC